MPDDTTPAEPSVPAGATERAAAQAEKQEHPRRMGPIIIGIPTLMILLLLAFALPAVNSGPQDLPIGITGPKPAVGQITQGLAAERPGAFKLKSYPDSAALVNAITEREILGGVSATSDGVTIHTAGAAGMPYSQVLAGVGAGIAKSGMKVEISDEVPLSADDPAGSGITALGIPLIFGGIISAVALSLAFRREVTPRVLGALAIATIAGLAAAFVLGPWLGTFVSGYWATVAVIALGIAAISLTVMGCVALWGMSGVAVGAVIMLFISNPLSGLASGPDWLPAPWGAIGQLLPVGATGTAVRSVAFFDGAGVWPAVIVLTVWAISGLALVAIGAGKTSVAVTGRSATA